MKSMTGFGRAEREADGVAVSVQVSSVNRRNLETVCSLPKEFQHLERKVVEQTRKVAARGRFQFSIEVRDENVAANGLPSDAQLSQAIVRLKDIAEKNAVTFNLDTHGIIELSRLIEPQAVDLSDEVVEELLGEAVDGALEKLVAMRIQEGGTLKIDLVTRKDRMRTLVSSVREVAPAMLDKHRENLLSRLEQAGLEIDTEDERVLKELALFADRSDISEEMTRLESHLEQFEQTLEKDEAVGRPLEFIIQEIAREINTTGSKSCSIEVSRLVLDLKNELERVREQVANVE